MVPDPPTPTFSKARTWPRGVYDVANVFVKVKRVVARGRSRVVSSSGEAWTHPTLAAEGVTCPKKMPLSLSETFLCRDAVDVVKLLRAVRAKLFDTAHAFNANVLLDEKWSCSIKQTGHERFRVEITYSASASRSETVTDPQIPVALDKAPSIPGLMTIICRE